MYQYSWLFPEENNLFFIDDLILLFANCCLLIAVCCLLIAVANCCCYLLLLFAVAFAHRQVANLLLLQRFSSAAGLVLRTHVGVGFLFQCCQAQIS